MSLISLSDPRIAIAQQIAWRSTPINMARALTATLPNAKSHMAKPPHIQLLSRRFVDAAAGRRKRQMIFLPPQHGKSVHTSWWGPTWFLDWFPYKRVILSSYATQFASSWGRKVRDTIENYKDHLSVRLRDDVHAVNEWETTEGGGMVTAGVGAGIAGRPADLLIIDDPHKDHVEAQSSVYRQRAWEWWQTVAESRLTPDAAVFIVTTRWHEDDLPGRLLATPDSGDWEVTRLPALAYENRLDSRTGKLIKAPPDPLGRKPGEALWPERYDKEYLERRRRNMHVYWWDSIMQQVPPEQGEGATYSSFSSARNVPPVNWELDRAYPVHLRVDFNRNPGMHATVGQFGRLSPRFRTRYVIHEPRLAIDGMVEIFNRVLTARFGKDTSTWPVVELFGDATGRTTQMGDGKTYWSVVERRLADKNIRFRLRIKKNNPGKKDRVNAVNEALLAPDGSAEYIMHPECSILINDMKEQKWDGDDLDESDPAVGHAAAADGYAIEYLMPARSPVVGRRGPLRSKVVN